MPGVCISNAMDTDYRVYVGYPKIAQRDVTDSTLSITSMVISDPTPESFRLNQTQVIGTDSAFHPKIYSFDAVISLLGAAAPFTTVRVPTVKSKDGAGVEVAQVVKLTDVGAFGDYAKAVMMNEEVSLNIYGRPLLQEGKLPKTKVTYNKTVTMKGTACLVLPMIITHPSIAQVSTGSRDSMSPSFTSCSRNRTAAT